ncbi:MAG: hypothetical protein HY537_10980 [Deltaproteobacteria bacterium]|nr:hypothetical protein [Deltaproteobacteria bacterium]
MIYKVGVLGAAGKMGSEVAFLLRESFTVGTDTLELADVVVHSSKIKGIEGVEARTQCETATESVHVWIDFSAPESTISFLEKIEAPIVIGTTGFSQSQFVRIRDYARKYPVLLASNMSPGMAQVRHLLRQLSVPAAQWEVCLNEEHHRQKKDSPSGTANTLLGILKEKGFTDIQVSVVRAGQKKGTHRIKFIADDEEFEIRHEVFDRRVFAKGALMAAHFLAQKQEPRIYSIDEMDSRSSPC